MRTTYMLFAMIFVANGRHRVRGTTMPRMAGVFLSSSRPRQSSYQPPSPHQVASFVLPSAAVPLPRRGYHSTVAQRLNRLLFEPEEVTITAAEDCVAVLPPTDYRAAHVRNILKNKNGDTLRVGVLDRQRNDSATMEWLQDQSLRVHLGPSHQIMKPVSANERPRLDLMLAMQAPLRLERMLPQICSLGINRLLICGGNKVVASFWGSHLIRKPGALRACLVEGLTACGDTAVPQVSFHRRVKPLLQEDCPVLFPKETTIRAIAHPFRLYPTPEQASHNADVRIRDLRPHEEHGQPARMVLAIGPESGWEEPYELELFKQHGFQQVSMGSRVLRTETAVPALLALAHDQLHAIDQQHRQQQLDRNEQQ